MMPLEDILKPRKKGELPLIIAHRAGALLAPENTIVAIRNAIEKKVDLIEVDCRLTRDKKLVVLHDSKLERTTFGKGEIHKYNYESIKKFDAGIKFSRKEIAAGQINNLSKSFKNEHIPPLEEALDFTKDKLPLIIELKDKKNWKELLNLIRKEYYSSVICISFHTEAIKKIKAKFKEVTVGHLIRIKKEDIIKRTKRIVDEAAGFYAKVICINREACTGELIELAHAKNMVVFVWTVNEVHEIKRFIDMQVDGIVSDNPVLVQTTYSIIRTTH